MSTLEDRQAETRQNKKKRNRRIARVLLIAAAGIAAAVFICREVKMYRERDKLDEMREQYTQALEQSFAKYVDLSRVEGAEAFGVETVTVDCDSALETVYTDGKHRFFYQWNDNVTYSVEAYSTFDDLSNVKTDNFLRALAKECGRAYQKLLAEQMPEYQKTVHATGNLTYMGHNVYYSYRPRYEVHTPENVYAVSTEKPLSGWLYDFSKNGIGVDMSFHTPEDQADSQASETGKSASSRSARHTLSNDTADSEEEDPYHARDYADAEDFYEDYYDEFDDFEDAEAYYDDYG